MAGARRPRQTAVAPMEPGGGDRDTGGLLLRCFLADRYFFGMSMAILAISTLFLLPSVMVGRIATRGGSRRDGDIAMAIFASYVIGQFMPLFY